MKTKRKTRSPKQNPADENPPNVDALRMALVRKLEAFVTREQLRGCPRLACRRRGACTRQSACESKSARREASPDQWERTKAMLVRELARRRAQSQQAGRG